MAKTYRLELLEGTHTIHGPASGRAHQRHVIREMKKGDVIETTEPLHTKFLNKFKVLAESDVTPQTAALDHAPVKAIAAPVASVTAPPAASDSGKRTITPPAGIGLTVRPGKGGLNKFKVIRDDTGEVIADGISKRDARDLSKGKSITL